MSSALTMIKTNDTGLLTLEQLPAFRQYLTDNKCRVRKGNEHQVLFVGTSAGWAPIQKGAGGHIKTPVALRPVIEDFTKSPAERSRQLARQIGRTSKVPVAEGVCAVPVVVVPVEPHQVNVTCRLSNPELPADVEVSEKATIETWPEDWRAAPSNFHVLGVISTSGAADANKPQVAAGVEDASKRLESADLEHLQDLRDDFAIHCPLPMLEGEDLAAFAVRRWAYADQMMASRLPQYAD